jgi:spore germination cell wall hydrolase CwlJ-like protein
MRISHLVLMLGLLTGGVAQAQNVTEVHADYRAVPSLRQHLPLNIPAAAGLSDSERHDIECMAWNLYFEVRDGIKNEQIAVAWIPINRIGKREFSNDICANVFQYGWAGGRRHYQFSWAGIVRGPKWKREDDAWIKMQELAVQVYKQKIPDTGKGSTYFHWAGMASWAPQSKKTKIGSHVFWNM